MTKEMSTTSTSVWTTAEPCCTHPYLAPIILRLISQIGAHSVLDVGCGNGVMAKDLAAMGCEVVGCDPEPTAVEFARSNAPNLRFEVAGVYDDPKIVGEETYDAVVATEVVEHLYLPRALPRFARAALKPGGYLIVSTPYYGYLKNLVVVLTNRWDRAHGVFWDGGHIKFWSRKTLSQLLEEEGFTVHEFHGAGRLPYLWKSMVISATKN
jgi:2-polyprenyl-3-methyl-5-hydroxy-6-metoxy-1,4-benzoquinol methylase